MRKIILLFTAVLFALSLFAQEASKKTPIPATEISPNLYRLFVNERVTVLAFFGEDGTLLVDAAYKSTADDLHEKIKSFNPQPVTHIINTHIHGDHTGGNLVLGEGITIIAHENVKSYLNTERTRGDAVVPAFPAYALPDITFTESMKMVYNGQELQLKHLPGGHTNGDIVVYFPESNVIAVGDLLFADNFPYVDTGNGGHPFKYLENIAYITDNFPADATVIGGHGPIYTMKQYKAYRKTLQKTIDALRKHKKDGMSLEEMKEKRVLKKWESYGKFFITEDRWIETLYPFI
jgi:glyoxylase-like metal-dependent hydrolase (beta-lactamase superfamily II)